MLFFGVIWHQVWTFNQPLQPQLLLATKPALEPPPPFPSKWRVNRDPLLYTVGLRNAYEDYFTKTTNPGLQAGGHVWKTTREVEQVIAGEEGFAIYGVCARWDIDTEPREGTVLGAHALKVNARLVQLPK